MYSAKDVVKILNTSESGKIFSVTRALNELEARQIRPRFILPTEANRAKFELRTLNDDAIELSQTQQPCSAWQNSTYEACIKVLKMISGKDLNSVTPTQDAKVKFKIPKFDIEG